MLNSKIGSLVKCIYTSYLYFFVCHLTFRLVNCTHWVSLAFGMVYLAISSQKYDESCLYSLNNISSKQSLSRSRWKKYINLKKYTTPLVVTNMSENVKCSAIIVMLNKCVHCENLYFRKIS